MIQKLKFSKLIIITPLEDVLLMAVQMLQSTQKLGDYDIKWNKTT